MGLGNYDILGTIFGHEQQQRQQSGRYGFLPCAAGCQGSRSDPRYCHCICQGINHGLAWTGRPIRPVPVPQGFNPALSLQQFPELPDLSHALPSPRPSPKPIEIKPERMKPISIKRKVGRSFFHTMTGHVSADEKNTRILSGLEKQFGSFADTIVSEAYSEFFSGEPISSNRPELYELEENGTLDQALTRLGKTWVIGRPRVR